MLRHIATVLALASVACGAAASEETDEADITAGAQTEAESGPCKRPTRVGYDLEDDAHTSRGTKYSDNDSTDHATELQAVEDGQHHSEWLTFEGMGSRSDTDWFRFHATDSSSNTSIQLKPSVRIPGRHASNFRVCAFTARSAQCEVGTRANHAGMNGCCATSSTGVRLDIERPIANDTTDVLVRVEGLTTECTSYTLEYKGASQD